MAIVESGWTENLENLAKSWALQAVIQREMHNNTAKYYKILSGRLTMPLIMLTTVTSVGSFGAVDSDQYKIWMYITGGLNLFAMFIASMIKYLKPDERCSTHSRMSKLFDAYYREITVQLNLSPVERDKPDMFIETSRAKLEHLMNDSPIVSDKIIATTLSKNNISPPDDFKIAIYGREQSMCDEIINAV
jgi:hypothetical protein